MSMKGIIKVLLISVIVIMIIVILGIAFVYMSTNTMILLPKGELIDASESPNGTYTINLYLCNGGATTDYAVRGELVEGRKKKNIYWEYRQSGVKIEWKDEYTVMINDTVLDVRHDVYDWRKDKEFCESIR